MIPKATINDLVGSASNSLGVPNKLLNYQYQSGNPVGDFITTLMKHAQPAIDQMSHSPIGLAVQGKFNQVPQAVQQLTQGNIAGKPYNPTFAPILDTAMVGNGIPPIKSQNFLSKMGTAVKSDIGKVHAPDAGDSLYGSTHTNAIRDALIRNKVDRYDQLANAASSLYEKTIKPELGTNPKLISLDTITGQIVSEMRKMKPGLDPVAAKTAAANVINDLYDVARNSAPGSKPPTHIDTPALFNIRQDLNGTTAVKNFYNGTPLSDLNDYAAVAGRKALSDIIAKQHPGVATATHDYGLLKDAVPSLYKASQQSRGIDINTPLNIAGTPVKLELPGFMGGPIRDAVGGGLRLAGKAADTPVGKGIGALSLLGGGALLGAGATGKIPNPFTDINKSKADQIPSNIVGSDIGNHNTSSNNIVSSPYSNIKPDPSTGKYELPATPPEGANQSHYMSQDDYQQQLNQIGNEYTSGTPQYNNAKTQLDAQRNGDYQRADEVFKGNNVKNFMDNATTYNSDGKELFDMLSSRNFPTGFWNGLGKAGSIRAYNDPKYASQLQQIANFDKEYISAYKAVTGEEPTKDQLLSSANSGDQIAKKYGPMMQWITGTYSKYLDPYLALISGTGQQDQYGNPQATKTYSPLPKQPGVLPANMMGGSLPSLSNMPSLSNLPSLP